MKFVASAPDICYTVIVTFIRGFEDFVCNTRMNVGVVWLGDLLDRNLVFTGTYLSSNAYTRRNAIKSL